MSIVLVIIIVVVLVLLRDVLASLFGWGCEKDGLEEDGLIGVIRHNRNLYKTGMADRSVKVVPANPKMTQAEMNYFYSEGTPSGESRKDWKRIGGTKREKDE